jgi:hypothetical protein
MTQADWLTCTDPREMVRFLSGRPGFSDRKGRLLAVAIARRSWNLAADDVRRSAVEVAERHADGQATEQEYAAAALTLAKATRLAPAATLDPAEECLLLRDIFGDPFRAVTVDPSWLECQGGVVPRLARAAYDNRVLPDGTLEPARLAVLANALEGAGCLDEEVLTHLRRREGQHWRGCWMLDLVLGKS